MNKIAVIIGGSSGIGFEIIKGLLLNHYIVYNASRDKCEINGVKNITLDVTNSEDIKNLVQKIIKLEGKIDVAVYSAGFSMAAYFEEIKEEDIRYLFEVNFFGATIFIQNLIKEMKNKNYGRIFVISSIASDLIIPYDPFYSASKTALNTVVKEVNLEVNKHNIYISSILPGGTRTDFTFERKNYHKDDNTLNDFNKAYISLAKKEQNGLLPSRIFKTLNSLLNSKNPDPIVVVGIKNKLQFQMIRMLPTKTSNKLIKKTFKIK